MEESISLKDWLTKRTKRIVQAPRLALKLIIIVQAPSLALKLIIMDQKKRGF